MTEKVLTGTEHKDKQRRPRRTWKNGQSLLHSHKQCMEMDEDSDKNLDLKPC